MPELPRGIVLNGLRLQCPGVHRFQRTSWSGDRRERLELERSIGHKLFVTKDHVYASGDVAGVGWTPIETACNQDRRLHLFDLREALAAHARQKGFKASFRFGGELDVDGLPGEVEIEGLRVQPRLRLRVVDEGDEPDTWLVGRHASRWLVAGSLSNPALWTRAVGETAERLSNGEPDRGEVMSVTHDALVLRSRNWEGAVSPSDYTLTVGSPYVRRHHGAHTLRKLLTASGSLASSGKRNRYAVKDRSQALISGLESLGSTFPLSTGLGVQLEADWIEVRIQQAS